MAVLAVTRCEAGWLDFTVIHHPTHKEFLRPHSQLSKHRMLMNAIKRDRIAAWPEAIRLKTIVSLLGLEAIKQFGTFPLITTPAFISQYSGLLLFTDTEQCSL